VFVFACGVSAVGVNLAWLVTSNKFFMAQNTGYGVSLEARSDTYECSTFFNQ